MLTWNSSLHKSYIWLRGFSYFWNHSVTNEYGNFKLPLKHNVDRQVKLTAEGHLGKTYTCRNRCFFFIPFTFSLLLVPGLEENLWQTLKLYPATDLLFPSALFCLWTWTQTNTHSPSSHHTFRSQLWNPSGIVSFFFCSVSLQHPVARLYSLR